MKKEVLLYVLCTLILSIEFDYSILVDERSINMRQINLLLLIPFSLLGRQLQSNRDKTFAWGAFVYFGLYVLYCGISSLWSFDTQETLNRWIGLVICCIISYNISVRYTYGEFMNVFVRVFLVTLIISWVLYLGGFNDYTLNKEDFFRFKGIYTHTQRLALFTSIATLILFAKFRVFQNRKVLLASYLLLVATLLLTKARAFISFTIIILIYNYLDTSRKALIYMVLFGLFGTSLLLYENLSDVVLGLYQRGNSDITELTGRTLVWQQLIPLIQDRPVLGYGFANFKSHPVMLGTTYIPEHAHNIWLHQIYETGIVGSFLFTMYLIRCYFTGIEFKNRLGRSFLKYLILYIVMSGLTGVPVGANVSVVYFLLLLSSFYESATYKTKGSKIKIKANENIVPMQL